MLNCGAATRGISGIFHHREDPGYPSHQSGVTDHYSDLMDNTEIFIIQNK